MIVDSQNSDNEEDRQFVVEAAPQLSETAGLEMVQAVEFEEDEKHGESWVACTRVSALGVLKGPAANGLRESALVRVLCNEQDTWTRILPEWWFSCETRGAMPIHMGQGGAWGTGGPP